MTRIFSTRFLFLALLAGVFPATSSQAQDAAATAAAAAAASASAPAPAASAPVAEPVPAPAAADETERLEMSRKLHEIRPATLQVETALAQVAQRLPETERQEFVARMMGAIDAKKLEDVSVNAMATVFTLPELKRMQEYFSTPEARSISDKMPIYQNMIQPEIVKMLDKAMMDMRTGAAPVTLPEVPAVAPAATPAQNQPAGTPAAPAQADAERPSRAPVAPGIPAEKPAVKSSDTAGDRLNR